MISCSIYDKHYEHCLCDLWSSVNIMPKVIFEELQYPALSPTSILVQLVDSSTRYPEGIVENMVVRVNGSFILANFMVMDMEGDLGIQLILGRPFLRTARARIDVRRGEIHFCADGDRGSRSFVGFWITLVVGGARHTDPASDPKTRIQQS